MDTIFNYGTILEILMLLGSLTPLIIYLKYRKGPKIDYDSEYETDLPTDDPPAIVNAVCAGDPHKIGFPNLDGFRATILDLINRNYLLLKNESSDEFYYSRGLLLEINPNYDPDTLWDFEETVMNFLRKYEQDGIISMDLISEVIKHVHHPGFSRGAYRYWVNELRSNLHLYEKWKNEVKKDLLEGNFKDAFYSNGGKYLKIFGILGIITVPVSLFYFVFSEIFSGTFIVCACILWMSSFISFLLPKKIIYQWTPYGLEYYKRWMNFKRYIEDFSLIKNYSPESVEVWDKYIVYGTALGVASRVREVMGLSLPEDRFWDSDTHSYQQYR